MVDENEKEYDLKFAIENRTWVTLKNHWVYY